MKNVLLIGANGRTARKIVPRLLELEELRLTLFARRSDRFQDLRHKRVDIVEGDARRIEELRDAMTGQDIVVSVMGGRDLDLKVDNVLRVLTEAGGIYDELPEPFNSLDKRMVGQTRPINLRTADLNRAFWVELHRSSSGLADRWFDEVFTLTKKGETFVGTETSRASIGRLVASIVEDRLAVRQPDPNNRQVAKFPG